MNSKYFPYIIVGATAIALAATLILIKSSETERTYELTFGNGDKAIIKRKAYKQRLSNGCFFVSSSHYPVACFVRTYKLIDK